MRSFAPLLVLAIAIAASFIFAQARSQVSGTMSAPGTVPSGYSILGETPSSPPGYTLQGEIETGGWRVRVGGAYQAFATAVEVNGKFYVIGGYDSTGLSSRNEEYDPLTQSWTIKASMPTPRWHATSAAVNGKMYVIGGADGNFAALAVVEEYDPATDTWTTRASLPTARFDTGSAEIGGEIYVVGGAASLSDQNGVTLNEIYDSVTNTWQTKAPMLSTHLHPAVAEIDGRLYVAGGKTVTTEAYDPTTDTWSLRSASPLYSQRPAGAILNGQLYFAMNAPQQATIQYDPIADHWTAGVPLPCPAQADVLFASTGSELHAFAQLDHWELAPSVVYYVHRRN